jgi:hypothetical protein
MVMGRVKVLDRKGMKLNLFVCLLFVVVGHREVDTWGSSHGKLQAKHVCQNRHRGSRLTILGELTSSSWKADITSTQTTLLTMVVNTNFTCCCSL